MGTSKFKRSKRLLGHSRFIRKAIALLTVQEPRTYLIDLECVTALVSVRSAIAFLLTLIS